MVRIFVCNLSNQNTHSAREASEDSPDGGFIFNFIVNSWEESPIILSLNNPEVKYFSKE